MREFLKYTRRCLVAAVCCAVCPNVAADAQRSYRDVANAARLNNLGAAYMNQQNGDKALSFYRQAIAANELAATPHLNAGITLLNAQQSEAARIEIERAAALNPSDPRIWYNLGLLEKDQDKTDAEIEAFRRVLRIDPGNADAHYFLGTAYSEKKQYGSAQAEFQRALAIAPLHVSAEFGLARALQISGNKEAARVHFDHFQHVTQARLASPMSQSYGEQGAYSLAEEMKLPNRGAGPMIAVTFHPIDLPKSASTGGMCLIDLAGDGRESILATAADGVTLYRKGPDGNFAAQNGDSLGLRIGAPALACAVGDLDNDGKPDVVIATDDRLLVFRNKGDATFEDITRQTGTILKNHPTGLTLVDYDHDGDLDLLVTGAAKTSDATGLPNTLWRNNGNLTFTDQTVATGLGGHEDTRAAVLSDLNNDRAVDLAIASGKGGVTLYLNQREGKFVAKALYPPSSLPPAIGVTILDYNKDGWMDVAVTHDGSPSLTLWRNVEGKAFERVLLPPLGLMKGSGVTPIDFDNDGWIDLAVVGRGAKADEVRLLRNLGTGKFADVSSQTGLGRFRAGIGKTLLAADLDGDGAADLLVAGGADAGPAILRNEGGNRHRSVQIVLHGFADNKTAIGTKVELFAGGQWQKWEVASSSGFGGQGSSTILAGLGDTDQVDVIRMLWPTGVPQDEISPSPAAKLEVTELDRRGSSCPVVFAWNGDKYEFVADTIGAAVIGHWTGVERYNTADPDEWIKVAGKQLRPYHGYLSLRIGEPMEEVNYLDQVRLRAIDHPADTEVFPDERFQNDPPFASGKTIIERGARPVTAAWDDQGNEVTDLLRDRDRQYVGGFSNLSYAGFAKPHTLTLDLGEWNSRNPLRLLMTGFIEYFSASSMYAAQQAGLSPGSPYVEAQMPDGTWKRVVDDMGFPAGLARTIVVDLTGKLPSGTRKIRLTTNLQIYWDQILVANNEDVPAMARETELPLQTATLASRGYPRQIDGKTPGDLTYDYDEVSSSGPFFYQRGAYTRYGDVAPLLRSIDDQFAIFGTGEDIDLEFAASSLPPLPRGWKRDYFFYANGFVKDMDYYEALPYTVSQLPFHAMLGYPYAGAVHYPDTRALTEYQLQWNSRMESGVGARKFQFDFHPRAARPEILP